MSSFSPDIGRIAYIAYNGVVVGYATDVSASIDGTIAKEWVINNSPYPAVVKAANISIKLSISNLYTGPQWATALTSQQGVTVILCP